MDSTVDLTAAEGLNADLTGVFAAAANLQVLASVLS